MISTGKRSEWLRGMCYSVLNKEDCSIFKPPVIGIAILVLILLLTYNMRKEWDRQFFVTCFQINIWYPHGKVICIDKQPSSLNTKQSVPSPKFNTFILSYTRFLVNHRCNWLLMDGSFRSYSSSRTLAMDITCWHISLEYLYHIIMIDCRNLML